MRILVWLFIASAVFVGVQVVWIVFIRNRDGYNITEQDAITRQTLALVFVLMLVQFRRGYDIAETAGYVWALFLYDLIWCGVCFFAGWSAVQHRVFVLFDVIRANFKRVKLASPGPIPVWFGYGMMMGALTAVFYFWLQFRTQLAVLGG